MKKITPTENYTSYEIMFWLCTMIAQELEKEGILEQTTMRSKQ